MAQCEPGDDCCEGVRRAEYLGVQPPSSAEPALLERVVAPRAVVARARDLPLEPVTFNRAFVVLDRLDAALLQLQATEKRRVSRYAVDRVFSIVPRWKQRQLRRWDLELYRISRPKSVRLLEQTLRFSRDRGRQRRVDASRPETLSTLFATSTRALELLHGQRAFVERLRLASVGEDLPLDHVHFPISTLWI